MREIKFRGIYPHSGTFFYGDFVNHFQDTPRIVTTNSSTPIKIETLGQFTGLKDKNGEDIYEGDILKINDSVQVVEFHKSLFVTKYIQKTDNGFCAWRKDLYSIWKPLIIGNIHQNPELL